MSASDPDLQPVIQRDDVQDVQVLALVLVDALDLHVEQRVRIDDHAGALAARMRRSRALFARLIARQRVAEAGVVGQRLELAQLRRGS